MLLANVIFGERGTHKPEELEDVVSWYLSFLWKGGQIGRDYFYAWTKGVLNASVSLAGNNAFALHYHTKIGKEYLCKVTEAFGQSPRWVLLDDAASKRPPRWKTASCLYLFTHAWDKEPVVYNADTSVPVPTYLLPLDDQTKEEICSWRSTYADHDAIWFQSGALEIPAYRQLADPSSELSQTGRDLCKTIEEATGIPTYYYMMRYWGRRDEEAKRKCPLCGGDWLIPTGKRKKDALITYRCEACRLISSFATFDDDERHARIGEYRKCVTEK